MNELGNYLKKLRKNKNKSIRKASEEIGISHTYLDSLEKGYDPRTKKERKPTPEVIKKISNYYKVPYMQLMNMAGYTNFRYDTLAEAFGFDQTINNKKDESERVFGYFIENLRKLSGKSIEKISNESGLPLQYLQDIENGKIVDPPKDQLKKLASALDTEYLFLLDATGFIEEAKQESERLRKEFRKDAPEEIDIFKLIDYAITGSKFTYKGKQFSLSEKVLFMMVVHNLAEKIKDKDLTSDEIVSLEKGIMEVIDKEGD